MAYLSKRSYTEDFAFGIANNQKLACAVCFEYVGWIKIDETKEKEMSQSVLE